MNGNVLNCLLRQVCGRETHAEFFQKTGYNRLYTNYKIIKKIEFMQIFKMSEMSTYYSHASFFPTLPPDFPAELFWRVLPPIQQKLWVLLVQSLPSEHTWASWCCGVRSNEPNAEDRHTKSLKSTNHDS